MKKSTLHIVIFFLIASSFSGFSQTRKELETQRKRIRLDIKRVNKLLVTQQKKEQNEALILPSAGYVHLDFCHHSNL